MRRETAVADEISYDASPLDVRDEIVRAHRRAWARLAEPGTWWDGAARVAIAAEARQARACGLCRRRKSALSPAAESGNHECLGDLAMPLVEVVHRVTTDASRLTRRWYEGVIAAGVGEGEYVETVAIIATVTAVDSFAEALDMPPHPLPEARPGQPTRIRPAGARRDLAWVPTVAPEDVTPAEGDLYEGLGGANIHRALSLVPAEVGAFFDLDSIHYLPDAVLRDFGTEYRELTHAQIELLAARVSAINQCFY